MCHLVMRVARQARNEAGSKEGHRLSKELRTPINISYQQLRHMTMLPMRVWVDVWVDACLCLCPCPRPCLCLCQGYVQTIQYAAVYSFNTLLRQTVKHVEQDQLIILGCIASGFATAWTATALAQAGLHVGLPCVALDVLVASFNGEYIGKFLSFP